MAPKTRPRAAGLRSTLLLFSSEYVDYHTVLHLRPQNFPLAKTRCVEYNKDRTLSPNLEDDPLPVLAGAALPVLLFVTHNQS